MTVTSSASTLPAGRVGGRLLILAAVALTALNLRTAVTSFSAVADVIGLGAVTTGAVGTTVTACFAIFGFLAPVASRRWGLERTAAVALGLTATGILLRSLSDAPLALVAATIVAFAGVGTSNVIVIPLVKQHFPDRIAALSTTYLVLLQVGQFAAPLVAVPIALTAGWPLAIGLWCVPTAVAAVLWGVAAGRARRRGRGASVPGAVPAPSPSAARPRGRAAWGLILLFGATSFHVYALITWLPAMFIAAGLPLAAAAALLALFSSLGLVAAFTVPAAAVRLRDPFVVVVVCVALLAVGYLGLLLAPAAGAVAWAICLGLGVSTFPLCMTLVAARSHDAASAAALSGRMQGIGYAIACVAPILLGSLVEATGSWTPALVCLLVALLGTLAAGRAATRPA